MIDESLGQLPDKRNINHVHSIRNDAQHNAKYPLESDVNDCRTYVRDFLQQVLTQVWGLSIEKISLTDLIQHDMVRNFLVKAETMFAQSDYKEAALAAVLGLTRTMDLIKKAMLGRMHNTTKAFVVEQGGKQKPDKEVFQTFERTREALVYVALGLNYVDYMRYENLLKKLMLIVRVYEDGTHRYYGSGLITITPDITEYLVTYCIDTVVQIESRVGNLEKPFK